MDQPTARRQFSKIIIIIGRNTSTAIVTLTMSSVYFVGGAYNYALYFGV